MGVKVDSPRVQWKGVSRRRRLLAAGGGIHQTRRGEAAPAREEIKRRGNITVTQRCEWRGTSLRGGFEAVRGAHQTRRGEAAQLTQ